MFKNINIIMIILKVIIEGSRKSSIFCFSNLEESYPSSPYKIE